MLCLLYSPRAGRAAHVVSDVASGCSAYLRRRGSVPVLLLVGHQGRRRVSAHGTMAHVVAFDSGHVFAR